MFGCKQSQGNTNRSRRCEHPVPEANPAPAPGVLLGHHLHILTFSGREAPSAFHRVGSRGRCLGPPPVSRRRPAAAAGGRTCESAPIPDDIPFLPPPGEDSRTRSRRSSPETERDLSSLLVAPAARGVLRNSILGDLRRHDPCSRGPRPGGHTKPYYRSTYYFVSRPTGGCHLRSSMTHTQAPEIGVNMDRLRLYQHPPAHALGFRGHRGPLGFRELASIPSHRPPDDIIRAVAKDSITWRSCWGPLRALGLAQPRCP